MLRLRWPVPALLAWGVAWVVYWMLWQAGLSSAYALLVASMAGIVLSLAAQSWWRKVIVAAGFPLALESRAAGLAKRSWVKISQVRTLSVDRMGKRLGRASDEELARVVEGLNEIIGG